MHAVVGTYENGFVSLDQTYPTNKPVKVIITFLEEFIQALKKDFHCQTFHLPKAKKIWKALKVRSAIA